MIRYDIVRSVNNSNFLAVAIHRNGSTQYQGLSSKADDWAEWASDNLQSFGRKSLGADLEVIKTSYASSEEQLSQAIQRLKQEGIPMRIKGTATSTTKTGAWSTTPSFREFQLSIFAPETREMVIDFKALAFVADTITSSKVLVSRVARRSEDSAQSFELSTKAAKPRLGARIGGGLRAPSPGMAFVDVTGQVDADADGIVFERTPMQRPIIPRLNVDGSFLQVPRSSAMRAQEQDRLAARRSISDRRTGMRSFSEPDADLAAELDDIADRQRDLNREDAAPLKPRKTVAQLRQELEARKARRAQGMASSSEVPEGKIRVNLSFGELVDLRDSVDAMRNDNSLGNDTEILDPLSQSISDALDGADSLVLDRDVAEKVREALDQLSTRTYDKRASQISSVLSNGLDSETREWTSPTLEDEGTQLNLPIDSDTKPTRRKPGAVRRAIASSVADSAARQRIRRQRRDRDGMRSGSAEQWNRDRAFDLRQDEMGDELDLRAQAEAVRAEESAAEMYDMEREIAIESFSGSSDYNDAFAQWMADEKPGRSPSAITDELRDEFESSDAYAGALDTYMLDNADDLAQAVAGSRRRGMRSRASASERSGDRLVVDSMGREDFRPVKSRVDELLERQAELRNLMDKENDEDALGALDDELVSVGQELDGISQALSGYLREDRGRQLDAMATDIAIGEVRKRISQLEGGAYEDKPAGQKIKTELERALSELTARRRDLDELYSDGNGAERLYEEAGLDELEDELSIDKSPRVWSGYNYDWNRIDIDVDRETAEAFADELLGEYVGDIPSPEDVSRVYDFRKIQLDTGNSRAIEKLTWDGEEGELIVTFAGGRTYTYKDVDEDIAREIESSPENLGRLINNIKKNYEVQPGGEHAPDSTLTENAAQRARYGMRSQSGGMRSYQDIAQAMFRDSDDFDTAMDDYIDSPEGIDDGEGDLPTARDFLNSRTYQEYLAKFIEDNSDDIDSVYYMSRDGKPLAGDELDRAIEIREASGMRSTSDKPAQNLVQRTLERADVAFGGYARWDDDTYDYFDTAGRILDGEVIGDTDYARAFEDRRDRIASGEYLTGLTDEDRKLVAGIFDRAAKESRKNGLRLGSRRGGSRRGMRSTSDKPAQNLVRQTLDRADSAFGGYARWDDDTYSNFISAGEVLDGVIPGGPEYTKWFESARDGINSGELLTDLSDNDKQLVAGIFDRAARLSRDGGSRRGMRSTAGTEDLQQPDRDTLDWIAENSGQSVDGLSLTSTDMRSIPYNVVFKDSEFMGSSFAGRRFADGLSIQGSDLRRTDFSESAHVVSDLQDNDFTDADMSLATFVDTDFRGSQFAQTDFSSAAIIGGDFRKTDFSNCDFRHSRWKDRSERWQGTPLTLKNARFTGCDFRGADFRIEAAEASLIDCDFSDANLDGVGLNMADISSSTFERAEMSSAELGRVTARETNFSDAFLIDANLRGGTFARAKFNGADMRGADLTNANLTGADLGGADLRGADLSGANLSGADLRGADLSDANLSGANLNGAILDGAQLDQGWEQVVGMRSRSRVPNATPLSREQLDSLSDKELVDRLIDDRFNGLSLDQAAKKYGLPNREEARRLEARELRRRRLAGEPVLTGSALERALMRDLGNAGLTSEEVDYLFYNGVDGIPGSDKQNIAREVIAKFNKDFNVALFDESSERPEMRSRSVGSARSRSILAVEDRAKQQRGGRATRGLDPGISQISDADGRIWASLTDDDKSTVAARARQREKDLLTYFKRRYPNYWAEVMDRSQSDKWKKKEGWIDEETPITQMIFELDSRVRKSQNDSNLSPTMKAELLRNMDDLRALFNMRNNDSYEMLEHLHPSSRGYLFDDAKRNDGKTTAATASGVKRSPSTFFGKVNRAEMVQPEAATSTPDGGSDAAPKKEKAPVGERVAAWAEKMRDSVLYESERRRRLRQMREARKNGVNAGAFSPDERQPLKPLERKARLAKRALLLKKGAKRDIPELTNDANKNRVVGRLAVRDAEGNVTISENLPQVLGAAFDADKKHERLKKSKKKAPEGGWRNEDLAFLWDGAGFNGTPMPVTQEQYNALLEAGWTPIVRGHGANRYAEDYIDDPVRFIPGQGGEAAGPGDYFSLIPQGLKWYGFVSRTEPTATVGLLPPDSRRISQSDLRKIQKDHRTLVKAIRAFDAGLPEGEREKMDGGEYADQVTAFARESLGESYDAIMSSDMGQIVAQLLNQLSTASPSRKRDILDSLKYLNLIANKDTPNYYAPILGYDSISVDERELIMNRTGVVVLGETKDYDGLMEIDGRVRGARRQ